MFNERETDRMNRTIYHFEHIFSIERGGCDSWLWFCTHVCVSLFLVPLLIATIIHLSFPDYALLTVIIFSIPLSNRQSHETMNSEHDMIWYLLTMQHGSSMKENFLFFSSLFFVAHCSEAEVIRHKTEKRATKHWTKLKYNLMLSNHFKSNISSGDISFFIIILCLDDANMWYTFSIRYVLDTAIIFIRSSHKLAFRVVHTFSFSSFF